MINRVKVPMTGGVNLFVDPASIRDDQVVLAKNLAPVKPGIIGTRPALQWARDVRRLPASTPYIPVRCMASPIGPEFAVAWWVDGVGSTSLLLIDTDGVSGSVVGIGLSDSPIPVSMVQWDGDTYAFTGQTTGARAVFATNPEGYLVEAIAFEGTGNEDFKPKGAAVIRDRFVYWGFDDGAGGRAVLFADRGFPLRIGDAAVASSRYVPVAGIAQSGITHCAELNASAAGSPNQSVVAVWTVDNMWTLLGEPGETGDTDPLGTLQQSLMTMNAGCVSGATVVQTPYGAIWTGPDDVWFMPFGSLPIRIGTNIRPALLNTPPNLKWKWHAAYDSDTAQYRLALFGPGSGPDEYSACDHHWILDLSKGAPRSADEAVWWGPQVYVQPDTDGRFKGTHCLLTKTGDDGDREMYGVCWYQVDPRNGADLAGISLVTLSADDSRDCSAPMRERIPFSQVAEYFVGDVIVPYDEDPGTSDPRVWTVTAVDGLGPNGGGVTAASTPQFNDGVSFSIVSGGVTFASDLGTADFLPRSLQSVNEIIAQLLTKEYAGDAMVDKLIDGAELGYWTNQMHRLSYRSLTDIDDNARVIRSSGDETGVAGFLSSGLPNPGDMRGQRIWKTRLLTPTPGSRSTAKSVQMMITQDTVFVVDETNDVVVVSEGLGVKTVASVVHGEYTHAQLMQAVVTALDTAVDAGWEFSTDTIGPESINHIRQTRTGDTQIWFADTSALDAVTKEQTDKCSRLFSMLGFDTNNATFSSGVGTGYLNLPVSTWVSASSSAETTRTARIQLSGLNLRVREFRRRPE